MNVIPMRPEWPKVRCDKCNHVYEIPDYDQQVSFIHGDCPQCHHDRFSTTMKTTTIEPSAS